MDSREGKQSKRIKSGLEWIKRNKAQIHICLIDVLIIIILIISLLTYFLLASNTNKSTNDFTDFITDTSTFNTSPADSKTSNTSTTSTADLNPSTTSTAGPNTSNTSTTSTADLKPSTTSTADTTNYINCTADPTNITSSTTDSTNKYNVTLEIVSREEWGALQAKGSVDNNTLPVTRVIVGHTDYQSCTTEADCITRVQSIQISNQESLSDIGYNFLVGGDDKVYEGRGWDLMGAHTKSNNNGSLGVAFIGNFMVDSPSAGMVQAFTELLELGLALGKVSTNYDLVGQCQLKNTESPGAACISLMSSWPHFNNTLSTDYCDKIM